MKDPARLAKWEAAYAEARSKRLSADAAEVYADLVVWDYEDPEIALAEAQAAESAYRAARGRMLATFTSSPLLIVIAVIALLVLLTAAGVLSFLNR